MEDSRGRIRFSTISRIIVILTACACFAAYVATAYRTITWWDSSEYTLAAVTFGIPHPPGSLLLVILGAIVDFLPLGVSSVFKLNLFAGLLAAVTTALVAVVAGTVIRTENARVDREYGLGISTAIGLSLAALGFGFGQTVWSFAIRFTPYILTPLFTVLIMYVLIRWWEIAHRDHSWRWLALGALLIGLDFSVHRTNALLIPGIVAWILICNPRTFVRWRTWVGSMVGLLVGLSLNVVMMPMAMRNPLLNANDPRTLSRLWDYVHVKQAGGGFLLSLYPRNSDLLGHQVVDWITALTNNFFTVDGPLGFLGLFSGLLALFGLLLLIARHRRIGLAYLALLVLTVVTTILYFNIPETFFRPFDRHYLPTFVLFMIPAAYAGGLLMKEAWSPSQQWRVAIVTIIGGILLIGPAAQFARNYGRVDGSHQTAAHDIALGMLCELAPNAILFTNGDNDTFPLWCLQGSEAIRPDVTVINIPLLQTDWYAASLDERDANLHFSCSSDSLRHMSHQRADSTGRLTTIPLTAPVDFFALPADTLYPDSFDVVLQTTMIETHYLVCDLILADIIANNINNRPIYFAGTVSPMFYSAYNDRLRREGLSQRLLPVPADLDTALLRRNLTECYDYRSFTIPDLRIEESTANFGVSLTVSWLTLADAHLQSGRAKECISILDEINRRLPPDRIEIPDNLANAVIQLTEAAREEVPESSDSLDTSEM